MKKLFLGIIIGAFLATAVPIAAEQVNKKVTATIRNDYTFMLDGQNVELNKAPLAYDGSAYLPVREMATLIGKEVNFKDGVIKLDEPETGIVEISYEGLRAVEVDGITYFNFVDYGYKYENTPVQLAYDADREIAYYSIRESIESSVEIDRKLEITRADIVIHKGLSYINVKHYREPAELIE